MIQVIELKGKDKHLYQLLAPLVMDPAVIRANNNYPFKTGDNFVWFVAIENKEVAGFIPVEQKGGNTALINNYYVGANGKEREEVLTLLLKAVISAYSPEEWRLNSITLKQDQEIFEKLEFTSLEKKWTRYVKMNR